MSEEEIIKILKDKVELWDKQRPEYSFSEIVDEIDKDNQAIKGLLDLYNKQKEEIKELNLENQAFYEEMNCNDNEYISKKYSQLKENSISKDEVLKALGYEENGEEYDRLKQDDEKLLAILDTLYSEVCRLEDIEDKKVEVAVAFIEEKRNKYWQDKIREVLEKERKKQKERTDISLALHSQYISLIDKIKNQLLEEK